jgi:DNA repair exonuclease SbcCD ATPase subunit
MGEVQGWITIGTRLDSKQLEKQLRQQKSELNKYAKDEEKLLSQKQKNDAKLEMMKQERELIDQQRREDMRRAKFESDEATRLFKQKDAMTTYNNELAKLDSKYEKNIILENEIAQKIDVNRQQQKMLNDEIDKTTGELNKIKQNKSLEDTGDKIGKLVKKVGRWGMAVFGVRSAYMAVRTSMSQVLQYDKQLAKDIEYMKYAFAMTFKPLIEWIVNAVKNLMFYVDYIAQVWFGLDKSIWASAQSMEEANDKAKKLKKTLLGFDEINQLGTKDDEKTPSFDFANGLADKDVPKWIKWIGEHKKEILAVVGALTGFFLSKKIVAGISAILGTVSGGGLIALSSLLAELALVGIIAIEIVVLTKGIEKLKQDINDLTDGQLQLKESAVKLTNNMNNLITKFNEEGNAISATKDEFEEYANSLFQNIEINKDMIKKTEETKSAVGELTGANKIASETQEIYRESMRKAIEELGKLYDQNKLTDEQAQLYIDTLEEQIKVLENSYDPIKKNTEEFKKNKTQAEELRKKLNELKGNYDVKIDVKTDTSKAKTGLKNFFSTLGKNMVEFLIPGPLSYEQILSKINFLAGGGIIDAPGRGVPLASNVIGGEAGAEAVLPLTNPETMTKLGQEIGKWITLNLDITNTIDGRVLNNRLETIKNNDNFSRNGG